MKELVEVIAKALVENPDEVVVTESVKDDETVIELSVAPADMGKVIGKTGSYRESDSLGCQGGFIQGRQESYCRDSVIQTKLKSRLPERVSGFFISQEIQEDANATAPGAGMQGTFYFIQEDYRMVDYLRVGVITSPHGLRGDDESISYHR